MASRLTSRSRRLMGALMAVAALTQSLSAFKSAHHKMITEEILKDNAATRTIGGKTLQFSKGAINEIVTADLNQDDGLFSDNGSFWDSANHFDSEKLADASSRLRDRLNDARAKLTASPPDGKKARELLGQMLHAVQDYYAHSNWTERHYPAPDDRLGILSFGPVGIGERTCLDPPSAGTYFGLPGPTSGYWFKRESSPQYGRDDAQLPTGKCYHGLEYPGLTYAGMNKDDTGRPRFADARSLAVASSKAIVNALLDSPGIKDNELRTAALMGVKTVTVAIDNTESMDEELPIVKSSVQQIVDAAVATGETTQYVLVHFKDWDEVSEPFITTDSADFMSHVNALVPEGGSYCPEASATATYKAVLSSISGSEVYTYTDAAADDGFAGYAALDSAAKRNIRIFPILTGSCSPVDPVYKRMATETGGQLFFLTPSELGSLAPFIASQVADDVQPLVVVHGMLGAASRQFQVPIDPTVYRAIFSVSADSLTNVSVTRPDGVIVSPGTAGVTIQSLSTGTIVLVDAPAPGSWTLTVAGSGEYSVTVEGNTDLSVDSFKFVEHVVDSPHAGFFDVASNPLAGEAATALASVEGASASVAFQAVTIEGDPLFDLDLETGDPDAADGDYTGTFTLPTTPFRVVVRGVEGGFPFQRVVPKVVRPQIMGIVVDPTSVPEFIPSGSQADVAFSVRNVGPAAVFSLVSLDSGGFTFLLSSGTLSLPQDGTSTVQVRAWVPPDTPRQTTRLTLSAVLQGQPELTNSTTVELVVGSVTASPVSIGGFSPSSGPPGTTVTIQGTAFGTATTENVVTVGATSASVLSATATLLVVTVPTGAVTGPLTVLSPNGFATSASSFVVESLAPTISGFTPAVGTPGTSLTISGTNFQTVLSQNTVALNLTAVSLSSATPTSIGAAVPTGAASGRITVTTPNGSAISAADFFVPPSPYLAADVAASARLAFGTTSSVAIGTAQRIGLTVFDGTAAQRVGLKVVPGPISSVVLYRPDQTVLATHSTGILTTLMEPPLLPLAGTYQFMIDPIGTGTGTTAVTLYDIPPDISGTIERGNSVMVSTTIPGQNARHTFQGAVGDRIAVGIGAGPTGTVSIVKPDGSTLKSGSITALSMFVDTTELTSAGAFALFTNYLQANTGDVALTLYGVPADQTGTIVPDGPPAVVTINDPGQNAFLSFSGTANQRVSLSVSGLSPAGAISLRKPDGSSQASVSSGAIASFMEPQVLATPGTYAISVDPGNAATGTVTLNLCDVPPDVNTGITIGAPSVGLGLDPGQQAFLMFNGTQGQQVTVRITGNTAGLTTARLLKPDGTQLTSLGSAATNFNLPTQTLPATGTYTIVIDPSGANSGTINVAVTNP